MKKLIYYLIFLLALIMMLLASSACRSPKTMTYSQATTDSINFRVRDSTAQRFEFTFDSLELWGMIRNFGTSELRKMAALGYSFFESDKSMTEFPNLRTSGNSHHIVVYGGKLLSDKTRAMSQDSTSIKTTHETKASKIRPSPSSLLTSHFSLLTIFALAIALLFFYKLRSKVSS